MRGGANRELLLAVVHERVQCAMEFGFSTLGDAARVAGWVMPPLEMWAATVECHQVALAAELEE
jgi:hypothetical protein